MGGWWMDGRILRWKCSTGLIGLAWWSGCFEGSARRKGLTRLTYWSVGQLDGRDVGASTW